MRLIVGLGNPGPRYFGNRHNVGFAIVERFASRHGIALHHAGFHGQWGRGAVGDREVALLKPMTFMNLSGRSVAQAVEGIEGIEPARDLLVVYDDLDLPWGRIRVRAKGGAGGHNGVADVIAALGMRDFARLRFGIGRPSQGESTVGYVLRSFSAAEREQLPASLTAATEAIEAFVQQGVEVAMNRANRAAPARD